MSKRKGSDFERGDYKRGRYDRTSEGASGSLETTHPVQATSDEEGGDEVSPRTANSSREVEFNYEDIIVETTHPFQATLDEEVGDEVSPWTAKSNREDGFNYEDIIERSNCTKVDDELIQNLTDRIRIPNVHHLISRRIVCSHRDMNEILDRFGKGEKFFLYTGRGPSSTAMHFGHAVPFILTKWLQDTFDVPLVIQITDDEKFMWTDFPLEDVRRMAEENMKDIISFGFNDEKTFIFTNMEYMRRAIYENICRIERKYSLKDITDQFRFEGNDCIGKLTFPAFQAAPCFSSSFPELFGIEDNIQCLVPCAIDQDSIFRLARDVAPKLGFKKPALLHTKFLPSLTHLGYKMSASHSDGAVFLTDDDRQIERKINTCENRLVLEEYFTFFADDERFQRISQRIETGQISLDDLKLEVTDILKRFAHNFKQKRNSITTEKVDMFKAPSARI